MSRFLASLMCAILAGTDSAAIPRGNSLVNQMHLGLSDKPGSIWVQFVTNTSFPGLEVAFGTTSGVYTGSQGVLAPSIYHYSQEGGVQYTSPFLQRALLTGLTPGQRLYYTVKSTNQSTPALNCPEFSFWVPVSGGTTSSKTVIMGDPGQTSDSISTYDHVLGRILRAREINEDAFEHLIIVGDLSYADSEHDPAHCHHPGGCSQKRWDSFGRIFEPLGASIPLAPLPGNHEIETPTAPLLSSASAYPAPTTTPFLAFANRFSWPTHPGGVGDVGSTKFYYSYEVGPVHYVHLNSYEDQLPGEANTWSTTDSLQYKWLEADLVTVDRKKTPWIVAQLHAPWYNSNTCHHNDIEETALRKLMQGLFQKYKVDMLFAGHVHAYERTYPVYDGVSTPGATVEINIGDGGNREGLCTHYYQQPEWSAYREASFGHGELDFKNATHAHWTWHRNQDSEDFVSDDVWLVKNTFLGRGVMQGVSTFSPSISGGLGEEWTWGGLKVDKFLGVDAAAARRAEILRRRNPIN